MSCNSDVSPVGQKLIGYRDGVKFAVRGETGISSPTDKRPHHRTSDVADAQLRTWALVTWDRFATLKL